MYIEMRSCLILELLILKVYFSLLVSLQPLSFNVFYVTLCRISVILYENIYTKLMYK